MSQQQGQSSMSLPCGFWLQVGDTHWGGQNMKREGEHRSPEGGRRGHSAGGGGGAG